MVLRCSVNIFVYVVDGVALGSEARQHGRSQADSRHSRSRCKRQNGKSYVTQNSRATDEYVHRIGNIIFHDNCGVCNVRQLSVRNGAFFGDWCIKGTLNVGTEDGTHFSLPIQ